MNATQAQALVAGGRQAMQAQAELQQYLTFTLGTEVFGIDILHVKEIIEYAGLTEVPLMPAMIRGVINLRGAVVPVIDLALRFGHARTEIARRTCIVIIEVESEEDRHDVGILVDAVNEVLEISSAEIEPAPAFGAKIRTDFIAGMGKVEGRFVILLNVAQVLSVEEMALLAGMGAGGGSEALPAPVAHTI